MTKFLERAVKDIFNRLIKDSINAIFRKKKMPKTNDGKSDGKNTDDGKAKKKHPWRLCPEGQYWVHTHPLTVPASDSEPERMTTRRGHCRVNPNRSEFYEADELREMAHIYFKEIANNPAIMPVPDALDFPHGNQYDLLIAGWTKFWNDVLAPKQPLSPDFVKALVATESSFYLPPDVASKDGAARGLIQITENTRKILRDTKGELKNHHINMTIEESREPEINLAAGIRWLHHKKFLAEHRLKREITWEEAGAEYKGILPDLGKDKKTDEIMTELKKWHKRLRDQRDLSKGQ